MFVCWIVVVKNNQTQGNDKVGKPAELAGLPTLSFLWSNSIKGETGEALKMSFQMFWYIISSQVREATFDISW